MSIFQIFILYISICDSIYVNTLLSMSPLSHFLCIMVCINLTVERVIVSGNLLSVQQNLSKKLKILPVVKSTVLVA